MCIRDRNNTQGQHLWLGIVLMVVGSIMLIPSLKGLFQKRPTTATL